MTEAPPFQITPVKKKNFEALDTLRTLLALSVATGHYFYWNGTPTHYPWSFFLAVDFFFILSGFVLTQSILAAVEPNIEIFLRNFTIRRLFRLVPLYLILFTLSAILLVTKHGLHSDAFYYFFYSAGLLQAMGFDAGSQHIFADTTIGISWSISVELWIGLLFFPIVYRLRAKPVLLVFISAFLSIAALTVLVNFSPNTMNVNLQRFAGVITFGAVRGLLGFSLGSIAFVLYRILSKTNIAALWQSVGEFAIVVMLGFLFVRNSYNHQNEFVAPFLFFALIVLVALGKGRVSRILNARLWSRVQPLSYAIYLIHPVYIFVWRQLEIPFNHKDAAPYLILILVTAWLLHRGIEKPWIAKGRSLLKRIEKQEA